MKNFYIHWESDCLIAQDRPATTDELMYIDELTPREYGTIYFDQHGVLPADIITDYQHRWADFMYDTPYCAGWIDMGLGKTVSTLMGIQQLIHDFESAHVLVIGPKRVARKVWTDEIKLWEHIREFDTQMMIGTAEERLRAMNTKAEIHLINRENVTWLVEQHVEGSRFKKKWHWDTVIIDESSSFSYQSSQRWKSLRKVRKKMDRVVQLTGTPDTRNLAGLWSQIHLLDQGKRLGFAESHFLKKWFIPPTRHSLSAKHEPKKKARRQIQKRLRDIVMVLRDKDYLDITDPWPVWHRVALSAAETKTYRQMERDYVIQLGENLIAAINNGVLANKLLQLANGFIYDEDRKVHSFHDRKTQALLDIVEAAQGPVIVAYNYIPDRVRIEEALTKRGVRWRLLKTEQDEDDWNAGKFDVCVLSPKSAGHGSNIYKNGCSDLVWYGLIWSLEQYLQTNARLTGGHRAVGKQIQLHHIVTEGTYEDRVRLALERNSRNQDEMKAGLVDYLGIR